MGQLHYHAVPIDELVRRSSHIVIAAPSSPPTRVDEVAVPGAGKEVRPYTRVVYRFTVQQSLRGELAPGAPIEVVSANDDEAEELHREYHVEGVSRHVALDRYEPRVPFGNDDPRWLFLRPGRERFAYAVDLGAEGLGARTEIERLVATTPYVFDDILVDEREAVHAGSDPPPGDAANDDDALAYLTGIEKRFAHTAAGVPPPTGVARDLGEHFGGRVAARLALHLITDIAAPHWRVMAILFYLRTHGSRAEEAPLVQFARTVGDKESKAEALATLAAIRARTAAK